MKTAALLILGIMLPSAVSAQTTATGGVAVAASLPATEKLICKRFVDTGSLVRGRKECRTRAWWDRIAEAARSNAQDLNERNMGRPSGQ